MLSRVLLLPNKHPYFARILAFTAPSRMFHALSIALSAEDFTGSSSRSFGASCSAGSSSYQINTRISREFWLLPPPLVYSMRSQSRSLPKILQGPPQDHLVHHAQQGPPLTR